MSLRPVAAIALAFTAILGCWFGGAPENTNQPQAVDTPNGDAKQEKLADKAGAKKEEKKVTQVEWQPLTEAERARWNRVRNKVRQRFEVDSGLAEYGTPALMDQWEKEHEVMLAERRASEAADDKVRKQQHDKHVASYTDKRAKEINEKFVAAQKQKEKDRAEWHKNEAVSHKEERARIEKSMDKARSQRFQILAYSLSQKSWRAVSIRLDDSLNEIPTFTPQLPLKGRTSYFMDDEPAARAHANIAAATPDARCAVIVDLYSGDDPTVRAWVHDDGKGSQFSDALPFPELLNPLKQFVHGLRTTAD